jgi:Ca2+-binding EF-hand superfamily protein
VETETIEITKEDLDVYYKTFNNKGLIKRVRMKMFNDMPKSLKREYKKTRNDFVCINEFTGLYRVVPYNCSENLKEYLSNFNFILTNNENSI